MYRLYNNTRVNMIGKTGYTGAYMVYNNTRLNRGKQ